VPHPTSAFAPRASGIREILDLVLTSSMDIDRLEIGEPGFSAPPHVAEAAAIAARGDVRYTQSSGTLALRTALVDSLAARYGAAIDPGCVVVSQGGSQGIAAVFEALVQPGDEVLLPDPAWPNYESMTRIRGAVPVRYPLHPEAGFVPDPDEVLAMIGPTTRMVVLNSPGNPTGAVLPRAVVRRIVEGAAERGVMVVSDEVYDEIIFEGEPSAAHEFGDNVVSVFSFSKTYAMTGWRVGYLVMPAWLATLVGHMQEALISCVSSVNQAAALAALTGPQDAVATMRDAYRDRRDLALRLLATADIRPLSPSGAFYLMVPLTPGVSSRDAALELVGRGVSFAPGSAFGSVASDQLRMSLASSPATIERGLGRFLDWYVESDGGALATLTERHTRG